VVSVLTTGPNFAGSNRAKAIKVRSTPSSRMESKAGRPHVVRFYEV
jgi:hypothetical protein